jgi:hypothetical protein
MAPMKVLLQRDHLPKVSFKHNAGIELTGTQNSDSARLGVVACHSAAIIARSNKEMQTRRSAEASLPSFQEHNRNSKQA